MSNTAQHVECLSSNHKDDELHLPWGLSRGGGLVSRLTRGLLGGFLGLDQDLEGKQRSVLSFRSQIQAAVKTVWRSSRLTYQTDSGNDNEGAHADGPKPVRWSQVGREQLKDQTRLVLRLSKSVDR